MTTENYFSKLAQIDCTEHVEKKDVLTIYHGHGQLKNFVR